MPKISRIAAFLLLVLLLSSCGSYPEPAEEGSTLPSVSEEPQTTVPLESTAPQESTAEPAEEQHAVFDNRSILGSANFVETDTMVYAIPYFGKTLMFWEKETGIGGPLCWNPECLHNTDQCNAYVGSVPRSSLSVYQGRIWWVGSSGTATQTQYSLTGVWSMKTDGTDRRLSLAWNFYETGISNAYVYEENCYAFSRKSEVKDGAGPVEHQIVRMIPLDGGEQQIILDRVSADSCLITPCFINGQAYFLISEVSGESYTAEISCWDPKIGEWTAVLENTPVPFQMRRLWIEEDGRVMISSLLPDSVYQLKEGGLVPFDIMLSDAKYEALNLSKGITIAIGADRVKEGERTINRHYFLIRKWDGTLLYEGELPTNFQNDIDAEWNFNAIYLILGDENALYIQFEWIRDDYKRIMTMVRYEITPEGLKEQLVWTSPEY